MSELAFVPVEDIPKIHGELRRGFQSGKAKSIAYRKEQLLQLAYLIHDNRQRLRDAFLADLGRPADESDLLEINPTLAEAREAHKNVGKWAASEKAPFSHLWFAMKPVIRKEPKGVVLIIAPFNYPVFLLLGPMAGAIAAGNAVLLKPSELTPTASGLLAELVPKYLDPEMYRLVNGAIPETTKILELPWDHILYTGSGRIGRVVATAAAKHLTPVSLELGGKSPVVIDPKCDLKTSARRILWGKLANAGQVCLAPDYVLVPEDFQDTFVKAIEEAYNEFHPTDPMTSGSFGRIISQQHTQRIKRLIDETRGTVVFGGKANVAEKYVAPTLVRDVRGDDALMSEEIFGPVLPIVPVKDVDEAIAFINAHDHPLAIYVFTQNEAFKNKIIDNTQSGAVAANEVIIHLRVDGLPFGGIGPSGYGCTTGKFSFDTFTHLRSTIDNPSWVDTFLMAARYPPYKSGSSGKLNELMKPRLPPRPGTVSKRRWGLWSLLALVGALSAVLARTSGRTFFKRG